MGKGFAVGRDVTARKEAEEREQQVLAELRESLAVQEELQRRLTTVIESMVDGVIELDDTGAVLSFNTAAESNFGYSRDEILGRDVRMLIPDLEDLRTPAAGDEADGVGAATAAREVSGRRRDGAVFPLDLAVSETTIAGRTVLVATVRDITERKLAEERDHHYRQTLEWAVRDRTRELQEQTAALEEARIDTLQRLAMAGEYHDEDTHQHTERVGNTAALLAQELGSLRDWVNLIRLAAPLHDLGKLAVSDAILLKQGPLDDEEWEQVKNHPLVGAAILAGSSSEVLHLAEEIALTHHEWWDGSGYPAGLAGKDIPLSGRIVTVADTFDALTHDRPYKPAWPVEEAVAEIRRLSGSRFDPAIVDAFTRLDHRTLTETPEPDAAVRRIPPRTPVTNSSKLAADTGTAA
jgi:putative two-component system response regulator